MARQKNSDSRTTPGFSVGRYQFLESRLDAGFLVEVAVASALRKSQLFDRSGKVSAQHVRLRLRAVLQQLLSQCGVAARLQLIKARVGNPGLKPARKEVHRFRRPRGVEQGVGVPVDQRA